MITAEALLAIFEVLPDGTTELGCHPAEANDADSVYGAERQIELEHSATRASGQRWMRLEFNFAPSTAFAIQPRRNQADGDRPYPRRVSHRLQARLQFSTDHRGCRYPLRAPEFRLAASRRVAICSSRARRQSTPCQPVSYWLDKYGKVLDAIVALFGALCLMSGTDAASSSRMSDSLSMTSQLRSGDPAVPFERAAGDVVGSRPQPTWTIHRRRDGAGERRRQSRREPVRGHDPRRRPVDDYARAARQSPRRRLRINSSPLGFAVDPADAYRRPR